MSERLDQLAESHGIQTAYRSEMGEHKEISDEAKKALLKALSVDPETGEAGGFAEARSTPSRTCALPPSIAEHRRWGIACQLYGLRSERNLGMGDFEDLARLAVIAAGEGASFVGVNPLHALFMADGGRVSSIRSIWRSTGWMAGARRSTPFAARRRRCSRHWTAISSITPPWRG